MYEEYIKLFCKGWLCFYIQHITQWDKGKGKGHPVTGHEGPEGEQRYSSTLPSTSALDGVDGQRHAPAALPPGKNRKSLYRSLGGPQSRSGQVRKISPAPGFDLRTFQPSSESLYRLSYPGPYPRNTSHKNITSGIYSNH